MGVFDPGAILELAPANDNDSTLCARNQLTTGASSTISLATSPKFFNISLYVEPMASWQSVCSSAPLGSNVVRLTGGGSYDIEGIIYGPADNMQVNSGVSGSSLNQVIAWTLTLAGGSSINEDFARNQAPYLKGLTR